MLHHIDGLPFMYYCVFQPRLAGTLVCKLYGKTKSSDGDRNVNLLRLSHLSHKVKKIKLCSCLLKTLNEKQAGDRI